MCRVTDLLPLTSRFVIMSNMDDSDSLWEAVRNGDNVALLHSLSLGGNASHVNSEVLTIFILLSLTFAPRHLEAFYMKPLAQGMSNVLM